MISYIRGRLIQLAFREGGGGERWGGERWLTCIISAIISDTTQLKHFPDGKQISKQTNKQTSVVFSSSSQGIICRHASLPPISGHPSRPFCVLDTVDFVNFIGVIK